MRVAALIVIRLGHAVVTMLVMACLAFGLLNLLGDPVENMAGRS
jgi:ABC-type dipeptide/oligopeptide/nickel transport system permease component